MRDDTPEAGRRHPREAATEYRLARLRREHPELFQDAPADAPGSGRPRGTTELERAAHVETVIQQAIRRGDFDDLPGAGKPLEGLGDHHDPDWWIRRKIREEQLTGLGPPALMLRVENAELDARLDGMAAEDEVREALEDFNRRVVEARRQLRGGPPVVTPTRDVGTEVAAWRERHDARARAAAAERAASAPAPRRRRRRSTR